jgi:SAM-dependent methyltransferase
MNSRKAAKAAPSPLPGRLPVLRGEALRWIRAWDRMQTSFIPSREERFRVMFDILEANTSRAPQVLDVGCGPGSLSARLLDRLPQARVTAVDRDPFLLALGRRAYGTRGGHLTWLDQDLRSIARAAGLAPGKFDGVLSTTALHWLRPPELARAYADLFALLRPGGLLLNGDKAITRGGDARGREIAARAMKLGQRRAGSRGFDNWKEWWSGARREKAFRPFLEERDRRYPATDHHEHEPYLEEHLRLLGRAGFAWSGVLWREFGNVVLVAQRPS